MPRLRVAAVAAAVVALALQGKAATREVITVEEVDVPVYVFNANAPIRNLTRDDFQLFVNGKPQPIDYFEMVDFNAAAGSDDTVPGTQRQDVRTRRLFLLLYDLAFNRPAAYQRAQVAGEEMIERAQPRDFFAVATYGARDGLKLLTPFTRDRAVILRAIHALSPSAAHDPLSLAIAKMERDAVDTYQPMGGAGEAPRRMPT
jgi:VWFA-related protein